MKIVKLDRLAGLVAALLLLMHAAPLFAARVNYEADLIRAARNGDIEAVRNLLNTSVDVNAQDNDQDEQGWSALMYAAQKGHTDIVLELLDGGADVNSVLDDKEYGTPRLNDGWTALMLAAEGGHTETAKALIDEGRM